MQVLVDYLKVAGITQTELAKRAGLTVEELNRFINGQREPRVTNLRKLARATGISIERLVNSIDAPAA
jgi:transcriptional regulator with XRE-family HTH domain